MRVEINSSVNIKSTNLMGILFRKKTMDKIPWRENASIIIGLYSILAALAGVLLTAAILDLEIKDHAGAPVILFSLSIILFIWGIEKFADALDENDVDKYLTWLVAYNVGVICLFFGIAYFIINHFKLVCGSYFIVFAVTLFFCWKWIYDIGYLFFCKKDTYEEYRKELCGEITPMPDTDGFMKLHQFIRRIRQKPSRKQFPHENAYTRLAPSKIHGVGIFAICDISKGTNVFGNDKSQMFWFDKAEIDQLGLSHDIKKLYEDFCVVENGKYGCPENFNSLTIGWYLNRPLEGEEPNMYCDENFDFIASRDIKKGEELTVDYSTYSESE